MKSQSSSFKFTWRIGVIALLCAGIFGFGGYYISKQFLVTNSIQDQIGSESVPTTIPNLTEWNTYSNYYFEFRYPNTFVISSEGRSPKENLRLAYFLASDGRELTVVLESAEFSLDYLKKYAPTGIVDAPEKQVFGSNIFYYYGPGGGGVCYPDQYFYNLDGKVLIFNFVSCANDKTPSESTKNIEQQILSTFSRIYN